MLLVYNDDTLIYSQYPGLNFNLKFDFIIVFDVILIHLEGFNPISYAISSMIFVLDLREEESLTSINRNNIFSESLPILFDLSFGSFSSQSSGVAILGGTRGGT